MFLKCNDNSLPNHNTIVTPSELTVSPSCHLIAHLHILRLLSEYERVAFKEHTQSRESIEHTEERKWPMGKEPARSTGGEVGLGRKKATFIRLAGAEPLVCETEANACS